MAIARALNQTLTYWEPTGVSDTFGKPIWKNPVQLPCRWEDKQQEIVSKTGEEVISKSRIFLLSQMNINGYVFLGESSERDPTKVDGAWEVQQVGTTPDLRNLKQLTTVYL